MPILIHDYVYLKLSSISSTPYRLDNRKDQLKRLQHKMITYAPECLNTQNSPHYSAIYRQKIINNHEITCIMSLIVEKIFFPLLSPIVNPGRSFWKDHPLDNWTNEKKVGKFLVVCEAIIFQLTALGNCGRRSDYAAMELFEILKNTDVEIQVRSWPEIDHCVLFIGNDIEGWKIYDPLTNPAFLFEHDVYNRDIKPLFKNVDSPKKPVNLKINEQVIALYHFQLGKISRYLSTELPKTTLNLLKSNQMFQYCLEKCEISDPTYQKTEDAWEQVCALLGWEDRASLTNNGLI